MLRKKIVQAAAAARKNRRELQRAREHRAQKELMHMRNENLNKQVKKSGQKK
jgi:hypothetical protein